jgi:hypothetical protein
MSSRDDKKHRHSRKESRERKDRRDGSKERRNMSRERRDRSIDEREIMGEQQNAISENSDLETALYSAKSEYDRLYETIERVKLIKRILNEARSNRKLTKTELEYFEESYNYHKEDQDKKLVLIVKYINDAKSLWEDKQKYMMQCNRQGILDRKVASYWNDSLSGFLEEISRLDNLLKLVSIE